MNLEAFVVALVEKYREHECMDIDGGDMHEMLLRHGITYERPATQEDIDDGLEEWDAEIGDTITPLTDEFKAVQERVRK